MNKHKSNKIKEKSNTVRHLIMGQIITTQNLVAIKVVRHAGPLPMWNERVRPLRDTSLFWYCVWKSADRPPRGALADIMRNTRAKYDRAVKQLRSEQQSPRRSKIADTFMCDTSRNFWAEIN